jgi:nitrite reductase/ring-hydroxylating ferredoxin subunit
VVARVADVPVGGCKRVEVSGRAIAIYNVGGRFYALFDRCPHQGGPLSAGTVATDLRSDRPGQLCFDPARSYVTCPWHGWEFDLATGQSWFDAATRTRRYGVQVAAGQQILRTPGPYQAEVAEVSAEDDYIVLTLTHQERGPGAD